ncbi:MAG: hypothetical protein IMW97_03380 [Firmicutes bacterium]|nr:hypothetical protein [Candidatus Fermentithermobacillaceae bacterium]
MNTIRKNTGEHREVSSYLGIPLIGSLPMDPMISVLGDEGRIEEYRADFLLEIAYMLEQLEKAERRQDR